MAKRQPSGVGAGSLNLAGLCKLCWKPADKRDRTLQGYHIECAKVAAEIIADAMHSRRGIVYAAWYRRRYPGRPVPGVDTGYRPPESKE